MEESSELVRLTRGDEGAEGKACSDEMWRAWAQRANMDANADRGCWDLRGGGIARESTGASQTLGVGGERGGRGAGRGEVEEGVGASAAEGGEGQWRADIGRGCAVSVWGRGGRTEGGRHGPGRTDRKEEKESDRLAADTLKYTPGAYASLPSAGNPPRPVPASSPSLRPPACSSTSAPPSSSSAPVEEHLRLSSSSVQTRCCLPRPTAARPLLLHIQRLGPPIFRQKTTSTDDGSDGHLEGPPIASSLLCQADFVRSECPNGLPQRALRPLALPARAATPIAAGDDDDQHSTSRLRGLPRSPPRRRCVSLIAPYSCYHRRSRHACNILPTAQRHRSSHREIQPQGFQ